MTARDELEEELQSFGSTLEGAVRITERILAEHAHELAEKIRLLPGDPWDEDEMWAQGCNAAADLIDPDYEVAMKAPLPVAVRKELERRLAEGSIPRILIDPEVDK